MRHRKRWMAAMMFGNAVTIPAARGDPRNLFCVLVWRILNLVVSISDFPILETFLYFACCPPQSLVPRFRRHQRRGIMLFRCRPCRHDEMEVVTSKDWYDRMTNDFVSLTHSPRPILEEKFMHPHVINLYQISALHLNTKLTYWALVPQDQLWLDWQL